MERLNEIMGRTPRRTPSSEQRAQQGNRDLQPQSPLTRRTQLPEQTTRPGQKYQAGSQTHYSRPNHAASRARGYYQQGQPSGNPGSRQGYAEPPTARPTTQPHYTNQRPVVSDSMNAYQTRPQPHQDIPRIQPLQPRPTSDYYPVHTSDDYAPGLHTDAMDEWEEDGLIYEDWEKENGEALLYSEEDIEIVEEEEQYPVPTYRPRPTTDTDPAARVTQNLRDTYLSNTRSSQQLPMPQARTGEATHYKQRITQPLDQQIATSLGQRDIQRQGNPRLLSSLRTTLKQEQVQHPIQNQPQMQLPTQVAPVTKKEVCSRCKGAGFLRADVPFGHPNFGKPIACECKDEERKEKRRQQLREMSNMEAFHDHVFETYNSRIPGVQEAYQLALNFAADPHGWLVLVGPNGCGKTHLAAAVANQGMDRGAVVLFEPVPDLLDHLRAAFAPTATEVYDQLFSKMREAELLILDDLGSQQSSPWANEKLFQLLNYRYNLSMPTVITTNNKGLQGIDERIRSRLNDNSLVRTVSMDRARDFRPTNVKKR